MRRDTLVDVFRDLVATRGEFLVYDDGYRRRGHTYADVGRAARGFAARLIASGLGPGDKVIFWGENRPEWLACYWGCVVAGLVTVPIDYRSSAAFVEKVRALVGAPLVLTGDEVPADALDAGGARRWAFTDLDWQADGPLPATPVARNDIVQIIFTSGATAEPKGVVIRHGNILANTVPVEREIRRYRRWARPFHPLRFLDLLPLSHLFGQSMATSIPPMLGGTVIFSRSYNPHDLVRLIRSQRVSVVVSVPKLLDVLREHVVSAFPEAAQPPPPGASVLGRWWRYRRVHRALGLKCWAMVVGAAPLAPELEEFWRRMGFAVIQGYGLTETAPIVTLNHPLRTSRGSVGTPIEGVEVRIADDGEILVRGDSVMRGYWRDEVATGECLRDGWLHTGDIGVIDEDGFLQITDRKKDIIVNSGGDNVAPQRVEGVIALQPEIAQVIVYGDRRPHLVALIVPDAEAAKTYARANGGPAALGQLVDDPGFQRTIGDALERANRHLSVIERVRHFRLMSEPFTIENGTMTPTLKLKRQLIYRLHQDLFESLYQARH
jgi:long-chain acyl-CoA synthetase